MRTNATPSDFPFSSTGFATYPVPLQFGQSSESTLLPLSVAGIVRERIRKFATYCFPLRITNKNLPEREAERQCAEHTMSTGVCRAYNSDLADEL